MAGIDYDELEYVSNRKLENDEGEKTGHVKVYSYDGEEFHYAIQCPYCGEKSNGTVEWDSPHRFIECEHCERSSRIKRIHREVKKEAKA